MLSFFVQRIKEVKGGIGKHTDKDSFNEQIPTNLSKGNIEARE